MKNFFRPSLFINDRPQKKNVILIFLAVAAFLFTVQLNAQSPVRDTVSKQMQGGSSSYGTNAAQAYMRDYLKRKSNDTSSWQYKMEKSNEKWSRSARHQDYQLFHKYRRDTTDNANTTNTAEIGFYGNGTLFWLNGIKEIEVAAAGVTPANAAEFIYHVTVNDSMEIVPWSKPTNFKTNNKITYAYLGKFNTQNKILKIEFYNIKNYKDKSTWILNSLYMPRTSLKLVGLEYNNKYLFKPFMKEYIPYYPDHYFPQEYETPKPILFNWSDSISHIRVVMNRTIQNDMFSVYLKRTINNKTDTVYISNNWLMSYYSPDPELFINSSYFRRAGRYEIIVVPEAPDIFKINSMDKAVTVSFTVLPAKTKSFSGTELLMIVALIILIAVVLFLIYYFLNKRRSAKTAQQKEKAMLELQSLRSQLNPHFMFNALAGIQNLMNKGDINATNNYLSRFSRITRNVLDDKNKEAITIQEEVSLLEDYLQMEQMRFGFNYKIHVDEKIDRNNTEIPSMLLQPYIENAVKHGLSSLKHEGVITVAIFLESGSLVMEVKDNGSGYNTGTSKPGNGTVLSEKRVDLINQINKHSTIKVSKRSDTSGTVISIELHNWV